MRVSGVIVRWLPVGTPHRRRSVLHCVSRLDVPTATVEEWDHVQAVNVRSVFLCYKAAAMQMIKQGRGGRIIGTYARGHPPAWTHTQIIGACSMAGKAGN